MGAKRLVLHNSNDHQLKMPAANYQNHPPHIDDDDDHEHRRHRSSNLSGSSMDSIDLQFGRAAALRQAQSSSSWEEDHLPPPPDEAQIDAVVQKYFFATDDPATTAAAAENDDDGTTATTGEYDPATRGVGGDGGRPSARSLRFGRLDSVRRLMQAQHQGPMGTSARSLQVPRGSVVSVKSTCTAPTGTSTETPSSLSSSGRVSEFSQTSPHRYQQTNDPHGPTFVISDDDEICDDDDEEDLENYRCEQGRMAQERQQQQHDMDDYSLDMSYDEEDSSDDECDNPNGRRRGSIGAMFKNIKDRLPRKKIASYDDYYDSYDSNLQSLEPNDYYSGMYSKDNARRNRCRRIMITQLVVLGLVAAAATVLYVVRGGRAVEQPADAGQPPQQQQQEPQYQPPVVPTDGGGTGREPPVKANVDDLEEPVDGEGEDEDVDGGTGSAITTFVPDPAVLKFLSRVTPTETLTDPTTPQGLAMMWLTDDESLDDFLMAHEGAGDELTDDAIVTEGLERYALATLYFATTTENRGTDGEVNDMWNEDHLWLTDSSYCEWYGITCDERTKRVKEIRLVENNVMGSLPREMGTLTAMEKLDLTGNQITGLLPDWLGLLTELSELRLGRNRISGELESDGIGRMNNLKVLALDNNLLSGAIPYWIGLLDSLQVLDLSHNELIDRIPPEIEDLRGLVKLNLSSNKLDGNIPEGVGRLSELRELDLSSNALVGGVPQDFIGLTSVERLRLNDNDLDGKLPHWIDILDSLEVLYLDHNAFSSSIPEELGEMTGLEEVSLHSNHLDGSVPESLCKMKLTLLTADCAGDLPPVSCSCCDCPN